MGATAASFGNMLREWRQRRRLSQLELACEADISTRHLSFLETGRSTPSRDMILQLAERLDVPLRERNLLLLAAGFAPAFSERPLDDPAMRDVRKAIDLVLTGHEPYPALVIDRHWTLLANNRAVTALLVGIEPSLLAPPLNVLRLSLHPGGLARRILNLAEWRSHVLGRLRRQVDNTGDPVLLELLNELKAFGVESSKSDYGGVVVPLRMATDGGTLSFFSTTTVFGTPRDITLSEIALESFFPADEATANALRAIAGTLYSFDTPVRNDG
jgi:transcriptional regulator with XRE-family HTH domain